MVTRLRCSVRCLIDKFSDFCVKKITDLKYSTPSFNFYVLLEPFQLHYLSDFEHPHLMILLRSS
jgi:hypothetical protein